MLPRRVRITLFAIAALAVALVVLGVSLCRRTADSQPAKMAAMPKEDEATCDLIQKYLMGGGDLGGANGTIWVEGTASDNGVWPFRVVRVGDYGKVTIIGRGAVDIKNWSLDVRPEVPSQGKSQLQTIHEFKLSSSEVDRRSMGGDIEPATVVLRLGFLAKGWIAEADRFDCVWLGAKDNDWTEYVLVEDHGGPVRGHTACSFGRANLTTNDVEYDPTWLF